METRQKYNTRPATTSLSTPPHHYIFIYIFFIFTIIRNTFPSTILLRDKACNYKTTIEACETNAKQEINQPASKSRF